MTDSWYLIECGITRYVVPLYDLGNETEHLLFLCLTNLGSLSLLGNKLDHFMSLSLTSFICFAQFGSKSKGASLTLLLTYTQFGNKHLEYNKRYLHQPTHSFKGSLVSTKYAD
jgi:hypothetical protein